MRAAKYWIIGGLFLFSVMTITVTMSPAAITQIVGIAAAQTSTLWNNIQDAVAGDGLTKGVPVFQVMGFNGTNFDRIRGETINGLDVDVTRSPGGAFTPADAVTNPTGIGGVEAFPMLSDGVTWNQLDGISANNLTQSASRGAVLTAPLSAWSVTSTPAVATQATASRAAGGGTVRHVATTITVCIATGGTAQTPILAHLRDGATGAGTILRSFSFAAPVNSHGCESVSGLAMIGTTNTAMTIEFAAAGVAASQETVTLTGFSVP